MVRSSKEPDYDNDKEQLEEEQEEEQRQFKFFELTQYDIYSIKIFGGLM
ncbi:MAG: hypothetical protein WAM88_06020 [Nitrososphaeraceae archaeon]